MRTRRVYVVMVSSGIGLGYERGPTAVYESALEAQLAAEALRADWERLFPVDYVGLISAEYAERQEWVREVEGLLPESGATKEKSLVTRLIRRTGLTRLRVRLLVHLLDILNEGVWRGNRAVNVKTTFLVEKSR